MQISHSNIRFVVTSGFYASFALFVFLFPLRWVASWVLATVIHELFHYCTISAFKIPIDSVTLGLNGIELKTAPMQRREEILCALAGPFGGLLLLPLARWMPCVAICALLQSMYNLLPIYPLDGGRAVRGILGVILQTKHSLKICKYIEILTLVILGMLSIFAALELNMGILPLVAVLVLILKNRPIKTPCKQWRLRVQ